MAFHSWVYHFDCGEISGIEVSGLNLAFLGYHSDNIFDANVRLAVIVDERASDAQQNALIEAFTGKAGGPLRSTISPVRRP